MTASPSMGVIGPKRTNAVKVTMTPFRQGERRRAYKLEVWDKLINIPKIIISVFVDYYKSINMTQLFKFGFCFQA